MANSVIQLKRSTVTAVPSGLANGELAYSSNGEILFIGHPDGTTGTIAIGGKRFPGVLTANQALVANATSGIDKVIVANLVATYFTANGVLGNDQMLYANTTGGVYWGVKPDGTTNLSDTANSTTVTIASSTGASAILEGANSTAAGVMTSADKTKLDGIASGAQPGTVTSVTGGAGLTGSVTTTGSLDVGQGNGIAVDADSIRVQAANGIAVDSGGVRVAAGAGIVANTTGVHVTANTAAGLIANSTALSVKVGTGVSFDGGGNLTIGQAVTTTSNVTFNNITASGNLVVNGTLVTLDVETLQVEDPLIALARLNTTGDTVDIGMYGTYNDGTTRYSGMFRDASNSDIWTFFANTTVVPTTTVDTAGVGYALAGILAGTGRFNSGLTLPFLANNGVLIGQNTSSIAAVTSTTEGHVLQISAAGVPTFGMLDGGTF